MFHTKKDGNFLRMTCTNRNLIRTEQSFFPLHRSIIAFQCLSCLASADPCFNSVRSEIYRPLWHACTSCHVPVLLYILFQRYFAVMFCDLFHWVQQLESHSVRENWAVLFLPKEPRISFAPFIWKLSFSWFYSWKPPLIRWMLDLRVLLLTCLLTVFSIFCV